MNFLPIIIALILAPIILYFIYKSVDEDKDDIEERSFKLFSWISDKRFDYLFNLLTFNVLTSGFFSLFFFFGLVFYYVQTGIFNKFFLILALVSLISTLISIRFRKNK
jgi:uncharacterized membrane protein